MVLNAPQSTSSSTLMDNNENVVYKPASSVKHQRTTIAFPTNNSPSPIVASREAPQDSRRRRTQSPPTVHSLRFPVEDADVEMATVETPSDSNCTEQQDTQLSVHLPRYLELALFTSMS